MSLVLGIESTCDETAAAVVRDGWAVLSNVVATQVELHAKYRGVVPEIASRAHIENVLPVVREALRAARCELAAVDAVAVANRPGLIGSLLIGVTAAKTLAWALGKPLVGVDHVQAHLYSVSLRDLGSRISDFGLKGEPPAAAPTATAFTAVDTSSGVTSPATQSAIRHPQPAIPELPAVGLVVSGGHTALYLVRSWSDIVRIGGTIDDAVGEAYDKVAALLGLGYPGGPVLDELARRGDPAAVRFPRTLLDRDSLDFSFSGLKTAVRYHVKGVPGKPPPAPVTDRDLPDLAAGFQAACVDVIVEKLTRAVARHAARSVVVGGGVSANRGLRAALARLPVPVLTPDLAFCTDNAAMIAGLGHVHLAEGRTSDLGLDAVATTSIRA